MPTSIELFAEAKVLHTEATKADATYQRALEITYKSKAGDMRYRPDLQGPHIRELGKAFVEASERWGPIYLEACRLQRAENGEPAADA